MLSKSDILGKQDCKIEKISAWDGEVYIKQFTSADFLSFIETEAKDKNYHANYVVRCLCDEKGNRLFQDNKDAELLASKSATELAKVFIACVKLNNGTVEQDNDVEKKS